MSRSDLAASGAFDGDLEQLHLKLLSLLDNPAVVVAAAARGDVSAIKDYLSKHPRDVCSCIMLQLSGYEYICAFRLIPRQVAKLLFTVLLVLGMYLLQKLSWSFILI